MITDDAPVRVFLLDDHEVVREGLRALLESGGRVTVVGEAGTCADALARIPATRPDVAVLDVQLPDGNGVDVCRHVTGTLPHVRCVMLTSYPDDDAVYRSVLAGAAGFVLKQVRGNDLVRAVERVARGEALIDPSLTASLLDRIRHPQPTAESRLDSLTALEHRILELITDGLTNRQIAMQMNLAEKTVKNYVSSILLKLGMSRRTEAAVFAVRAGDHA